MKNRFFVRVLPTERRGYYIEYDPVQQRQILRRGRHYDDYRTWVTPIYSPQHFINNGQWKEIKCRHQGKRWLNKEFTPK